MAKVPALLLNTFGKNVPPVPFGLTPGLLMTNPWPATPSWLPLASRTAPRRYRELLIAATRTVREPASYTENAFPELSLAITMTGAAGNVGITPAPTLGTNRDCTARLPPQRYVQVTRNP